MEDDLHYSLRRTGDALRREYGLGPMAFRKAIRRRQLEPTRIEWWLGHHFRGADVKAFVQARGLQPIKAQDACAAGDETFVRQVAPDREDQK